MSAQFDHGPEAIIHLDSKGRPRSVEINGFEIPALVGFEFTVSVGDFDRLSVTFYTRNVETRKDLPLLTDDRETSKES